MGEGPENRVERIVSDLLRGKRLRLRGGDAEEKAAITAAFSSGFMRPCRSATRHSGSDAVNSTRSATAVCNSSFSDSSISGHTQYT